MKKKQKLPNKRSLGGLRRVEPTSALAPQHLGQMYMQRSTLLVLMKQLNETAAEEVICNLAGRDNSNANGPFLTVEVSPLFVPRKPKPAAATRRTATLYPSSDRAVASQIINTCVGQIANRSRNNGADKTYPTKAQQYPPTVDAKEVRQRLNELRDSPMVWEDDDDINIRRGPNNLAKDLDRMRRIKRGGIANLPQNIAKPLAHLVNGLREVGLFLVPVGQLEGWLAAEGITISKDNKAAWSNEAALTIQSKGACFGDVWDFIRDVGKYLRLHNRSLSASRVAGKELRIQKKEGDGIGS